jgi:hypothetical protein
MRISPQIELLRTPLSQLIKNHTKEVAAAAAQLKPEDTRTLVEFLDLVRKSLSLPTLM